MGVFHVFKIVQMVPNREKHLKWIFAKSIQKIVHKILQHKEPASLKDKNEQ